MTDYKDLIVWQKSMELARIIYRLTSRFPRDEVFGLTNQIRRAVVSIPSNIAEGFGRKGNREFLQFLYQAKGSLYETQNFIILCKDIGYIKSETSSGLLNKYEALAKMLNSFISKVKLQ